MPILSSRASGSVRAFGLLILSALTSVIDTFNRANQSGLGKIKGQAWKIWRGAWDIVTNKASSSSSAGTYALATLTFTKTDVTVSVSGQNPGMGGAFWVTDADNWYASVYTQTQVCQTCGVCNSWNSINCATWGVGNCASGTFCCGTYNASTCNAWSPGPANIWNSANTGNQAPPYGYPWSPSRVPYCSGNYNASTCNANCCPGAFDYWSPHCLSNNNNNCAGFYFYQCNCTTEHRVNIIKSIAGAVSTVSQNLFSSVIASFRTVLSGNNATITAFSSTNYTSQIGNAASTSISPTPVKSKRHGIIKSTSPLSQGSTIDEFGVS